MSCHCTALSSLALLFLFYHGDAAPFQSTAPRPRSMSSLIYPIAITTLHFQSFSLRSRPFPMPFCSLPLKAGLDHALPSQSMSRLSSSLSNISASIPFLRLAILLRSVACPKHIHAIRFHVISPQCISISNCADSSLRCANPCLVYSGRLHSSAVLFSS